MQKSYGIDINNWQYLFKDTHDPHYRLLFNLDIICAFVRFHNRHSNSMFHHQYDLNICCEGTTDHTKHPDCQPVHIQHLAVPVHHAAHHAGLDPHLLAPGLQPGSALPADQCLPVNLCLLLLPLCDPDSCGQVPLHHPAQAPADLHPPGATIFVFILEQQITIQAFYFSSIAIFFSASFCSPLLKYTKLKRVFLDASYCYEVCAIIYHTVCDSLYYKQQFVRALQTV